MKKAFFSALAVLFALALTCLDTLAQATAQISGTVRDQTGAVLPGVEVTATQTDTGIARNTVTNETGSYVLPNLAIGPYKLEAALPGFRTYAQTGIVLQVNGRPRCQSCAGSRAGHRTGRSSSQRCFGGNTQRRRRPGCRKCTYPGTAAEWPPDRGADRPCRRFHSGSACHRQR